MRTVTNIFIVNLAVADFFVILFCLPPTVVWDVTETWFMGEVMCKVVLYFQVRFNIIYDQKKKTNKIWKFIFNLKIIPLVYPAPRFFLVLGFGVLSSSTWRMLTNAYNRYGTTAYPTLISCITLTCRPMFYVLFTRTFFSVLCRNQMNMSWSITKAFNDEFRRAHRASIVGSWRQCRKSKT